MREVFECVVLRAPGQVALGNMDVGDRIKLHDCADLTEAVLAADDVDTDTTGLLASAALVLQRYDACLLPVEPVDLPWARMALARARPLLRTPVLALAFDVKAPALADLLELGLSDFVSMPVCPEELRARLMRLAGRVSLREPAVVYGAIMPPAAVMARTARSRGRNPSRSAGINLALYDPEEPFRQAKARIVSGFERAYLSHALTRHEGNVAQAARASRKHRRAFWALLNKYAIDARDYRGGKLPER